MAVSYRPCPGSTTPVNTSPEPLGCSARLSVAGEAGRPWTQGGRPAQSLRCPWASVQPPWGLSPQSFAPTPPHRGHLAGDGGAFPRHTQAALAGAGPVNPEPSWLKLHPGKQGRADSEARLALRPLLFGFHGDSVLVPGEEAERVGSEGLILPWEPWREGELERA